MVRAKISGDCNIAVNSAPQMIAYKPPPMPATARILFIYVF
jgi:hypothetical protein